MEITRKQRRRMADSQKQWERQHRPVIGEAEVRHADWLWAKPIARETLDRLLAAGRVTHSGLTGVTGLELVDGSAKVVPSVLPLSRRLVPLSRYYGLFAGNRLVRTTSNPFVAWKWLALKAHLPI